MQGKTDYKSILSKTPAELLSWFLDEFTVEIPEIITSQEDMNDAQKVMLKLSGFYSYLMVLQSYAKIITRELKRDKTKKTEAEDMVDKKEIIQHFTDAIKHNYSAVSRAVTIYIQNTEELRMTRGTP